MTDRHQIWTLLDGLQMDLRAAQAKLVALRSYAAGMNLPDTKRVTCAVDGCHVDAAGPRQLAEHLHNAHDGPIPEHWAIADELVDTSL
jgi:hypothetical protein